MTPITVDELPDFLKEEYPEVELQCIAEFGRDGIAIRCKDTEVGFYTEQAFEDEKVTREMIRQVVSGWLEKNR